jgi:hypothetical protein
MGTNTQGGKNILGKGGDPYLVPWKIPWGVNSGSNFQDNNTITSQENDRFFIGFSPDL